MSLLDDEEITEALAATPGWARDGDAIVREAEFADFAAAMTYVNAVARTAEELDHHPDILIRWNRVTLTVSTHSAGGLTGQDFELARRLNVL